MKPPPEVQTFRPIFLCVKQTRNIIDLIVRPQNSHEISFRPFLLLWISPFQRFKNVYFFNLANPKKNFSQPTLKTRPFTQNSHDKKDYHTMIYIKLLTRTYNWENLVSYSFFWKGGVRYNESKIDMRCDPNLSSNPTPPMNIFSSALLTGFWHDSFQSQTNHSKGLSRVIFCFTEPILLIREEEWFSGPNLSQEGHCVLLLKRAREINRAPLPIWWGLSDKTKAANPWAGTGKRGICRENKHAGISSR